MFLNYDKPEKSISKVNTIHLLSLFMQIALILIAYFVNIKRENFIVTNQDTLIYLQYFSILLVMAVIPLSEYMIKQKLKKALLMENINDRIEFYIMAIIIKLGLIEFINLLIIVIYFLTGHKTYLYISAILALFFLLSKPGKEKVFNDLGLNN